MSVMIFLFVSCKKEKKTLSQNTFLRLDLLRNDIFCLLCLIEKWDFFNMSINFIKFHYDNFFNGVITSLLIFFCNLHLLFFLSINIFLINRFYILIIDCVCCVLQIQKLSIFFLLLYSIIIFLYHHHVHIFEIPGDVRRANIFFAQERRN